MPTTLVTGGAGFIGSHLTELLLSRGERVIVLDDLSTGSRRNLEGASENPDLELVVGSILDAPLVERMVHRADRVLHLAAAVGVRRIVDDPVAVIETNVAGSRNVVSACSESGVPLLVASTSEVYGKSERLPFAEGDDMVLGASTGLRWSYACSKAIEEFHALAHAKTRGLHVVVARYFNVAGPRQTGRYGMVIPRFVAQALAGEPITVFGTGRQVRCFSHVDDVVRATMALLDEPRARGEIVNLGGEEAIRIEQLARLVKRRIGSTSEIVHERFEDAYEEGFEDIASREPDLSKARKLIAFKPRFTLTDIVDSVVASQRADALPNAPQ